MLVQDLGLEPLFDAMGKGDKFLADISMRVLLSPLSTAEDILYRQDVLRDCLDYPAVVRKMHDIAVDAVKGEKGLFFGFFTQNPSSVLYRAVEMLRLFYSCLLKLKEIAGEYLDKLKSEGLGAFFTMLRTELNDDFLAEIKNHIEELKFRKGVLVGASLGEGNIPSGFALHRQRAGKDNILRRIVAKNRAGYTYTLPDRDLNGAREMSELRDRSINQAANATAVSADHILSFFNDMKRELGFYIGCINLNSELHRKGKNVCFPVPAPAGSGLHSGSGIYDACLALAMKGEVIDNDLQADGKDLVLVTGANRGGKSTFLRSIGIAQLMMQCGMFVPAGKYSAPICSGIHTHFKREEESTMASGKLDEELARMNHIVDCLKKDAMLLFNESFASTNEREGSELARQIVMPILEYGARVFFVTHFFDLADSFYRKGDPRVLLLRAERDNDGVRTFKIVEGHPLPTSYGEDLYNRIFGEDGKRSGAAEHLED